MMVAPHHNPPNLWKLVYWLSVPAVPALTVATFYLLLALEMPFHFPFLIVVPTAGMWFSYYLALRGRYPFSSRGWIKAGWRNWLIAIALPLSCGLCFSGIFNTSRAADHPAWDSLLLEVSSVAIWLSFGFVSARNGRGFKREGQNE
jgi:hypothetical protein